MTTAGTTSGSRTRLARSASPGGQVWLAFGAALLAGLVAVAVAASTSGSSGALGAGIGAGMVLAFFGTGAVVVNAVASVSPAASLLVALLTYVLEVVLVGLVLVGLRRSGALEGAVDPSWVGGVVIATTLVWLVAQIVSAVRSRQPIYDEEASAR
jgi:ATP synthase protein I